MSFTDPNPNPNQTPTRSGWASHAPSSPTAPGDGPPVPQRNSAKHKATTIVGGVLPRLLGAGVAVVIGSAVYWYFVIHKNDQAVADAIPATGTCFSWVGNSGATVRPCSDPAATYKAEGSSTGSASAATKTCDSVGAYVQFGITASARGQSSNGTICAVLNLKVGDCAHQDVLGRASIVPCTQAAGQDMVVASLQKFGSAAEAMSDSKATSVCGGSSTQYLSDTAGTTIVCLTKR